MLKRLKRLWRAFLWCLDAVGRIQTLYVILFSAGGLVFMNWLLAMFKGVPGQLWWAIGLLAGGLVLSVYDLWYKRRQKPAPGPTHEQPVEPAPVPNIQPGVVVHRIVHLRNDAWTGDRGEDGQFTHCITVEIKNVPRDSNDVAPAVVRALLDFSHPLAFDFEVGPCTWMDSDSAVVEIAPGEVRHLVVAVGNRSAWYVPRYIAGRKGIDTETQLPQSDKYNPLAIKIVSAATGRIIVTIPCQWRFIHEYIDPDIALALGAHK